MRTFYTLFQLPMVPVDGEDVPRPRLRAEFGVPEGSGWVEQVWVRQSGADSSVLNVLWGEEAGDPVEVPGED